MIDPIWVYVYACVNIVSLRKALETILWEKTSRVNNLPYVRKVNKQSIRLTKIYSNTL